MGGSGGRGGGKRLRREAGGGLMGASPGAMFPQPGGVAERFNAPVLKTGVRKDSWVRIPPPPLSVIRNSMTRNDLRTNRGYGVPLVANSPPDYQPESIHQTHRSRTDIDFANDRLDRRLRLAPIRSL